MTVTYVDRTLQAAQVSATRDNSEFQQFVGANVRTWLLRYLDMVSVDTTVEGKDKGAAFFEAIAPSLGTAS